MMTKTEGTAEYLTGLSLADIALQAASTLGNEFSPADLYVACYALAPRRCALEGYPQFVDSHRLQPLLCGVNGLPNRGYLCRVARNRYSLTTRGHDRIKSIREGNGDPATVQRSIDRAARLMRRFVPDKEELRLWRNGQLDDAAFRFLKRAKACGRMLTGRDAVEAFDLAVGSSRNAI